MDDLDTHGELMRTLRDHARMSRANRIKQSRQKAAPAVEEMPEGEMAPEDLDLLAASLGSEGG